ncbi:hypothetical protein [Bacillus cereus]|uniref:Uncharacterized protein n=1 Tax=Bacillus cereus TaxID=1396 RepID=A0A161R5W4_BACCE|nr:hypothetical protein [Bacillus cereus]KZD71144.1 hypothetical protein B4088_0874 [Bacillus cereus]
MKYFKLTIQKLNRNTAELVLGYNVDEDTLRSFYEGMYPGCNIISVEEDDFQTRHNANKVRQKEDRDKLSKVQRDQLYMTDRLIMWKEFLDIQIKTGMECYKVHFNQSDREVFLAPCKQSAEKIIAAKHNVPVNFIELIDVEKEIDRTEQSLMRFKGQIAFWEDKFKRRANTMRKCEYEYHKSMFKEDIKIAI